MCPGVYQFGLSAGQFDAHDALGKQGLMEPAYYLFHLQVGRASQGALVLHLGSPPDPIPFGRAVVARVLPDELHALGRLF